MTQYPEAFGMHDNVDIAKDLQETRGVSDSLYLFRDPLIFHIPVWYCRQMAIQVNLSATELVKQTEQRKISLWYLLLSA